MDIRDRIPPGQVVTNRWPILHHGPVPDADLGTWDFRVFGEVDRPYTLSYEEFLSLPRVKVTSDVHCVTGWSRLDNVWEGVATRVLLERAGMKPGAEYVLVHAERGFTANLRTADLKRDDVLLADRHNGREIAPEHGWPLRLVAPFLYFWKSAKWVRGLEFRREDEPGFWERRGYHMRGDPWAGNNRYGGPGIDR